MTDRRRPLRRPRHPSRSGPGARRRGVDRLCRASRAGAHRPRRRRVAAVDVVRRPGHPGRAQQAHRRRGARGRPGAGGRAPALQRQRHVRPGTRARRSAVGLGRAARCSHARARHEHVRPRRPTTPRLVREYGDVVAPATREIVDAARSGSRVAAAPPEEPVVARPRISASSAGSAPAPTHDDGVRRTDRVPWDDSDPPGVLPDRRRPRLDRPRAGDRAAPARRARPPPPGGPAAVRRHRPGRRRCAGGRCRTLADQHDGPAAEQLDARGVLRGLLPAGHDAPHHRGRLGVPAPARAGPGTRPGRRPPRGGAPRHRGCPRRCRPRPGRPGRGR